MYEKWYRDARHHVLQQLPRDENLADWNYTVRNINVENFAVIKFRRKEFSP